MEVSRGIILVGPQLLIFWSKNRELLEIDSFLPSHIYLGSWQTINFGKKILGTLGDALTKKISAASRLNGREDGFQFTRSPVKHFALTLSLKEVLCERGR